MRVIIQGRLNPYCNGYSFRTLIRTYFTDNCSYSLNPYCNGYSFRTLGKKIIALTKKKVLILIVMDIPFGQSEDEAYKDAYYFVLILIVMDIPFGHSGCFWFGCSIDICLNPYCNGYSFRT